MPAKTYIHRDDMLRRVARMPARKEGETDKAWAHRLSSRATLVAKELGLDRYSTNGRAAQYDEEQVARAAERSIKRIAA